MSYVRYPTNLILERPQMKHLFGKWWWDKKYKQLVKAVVKTLAILFAESLIKQELYVKNVKKRKRNMVKFLR